LDNDCISLILGGTYAAAVWLLNQEQQASPFSCHVHSCDLSTDQDWVYQFQHVKLQCLHTDSRTTEYNGVAVALQAARAYEAALLKELNKGTLIPRRNLVELHKCLARAEGSGQVESRVKHWQNVLKYKKLGTGATQMLAAIEDCLVRIVVCHVFSSSIIH
jgi:hypothetical protein